MWGTQNFLDSYAAFNTQTDKGVPEYMPYQFEYYLEQARLNVSISHYMHSFMLIDEPSMNNNIERKLEWKQKDLPKMRGKVPKYCSEPSVADIEFMHQWIDEQLRARCHPTRLWVTCQPRSYDTFVPCPQQLMDALAEDFSAARGWCNFNSPYAAIEPLNVDPVVSKAFQKKVFLSSLFLFKKKSLFVFCFFLLIIFTTIFFFNLIDTNSLLKTGQ